MLGSFSEVTFHVLGGRCHSRRALSCDDEAAAEADICTRHSPLHNLNMALVGHI